jgi:CHAD domain-containing protein
VADTQREIESKFDVAPDFVVGDLTGLVGPGGHVQTSTVDLLSTYHDTPGSGLLRSHLTLRRRTGAADTGWHLKVPGDGFRTELRWPLAGNDRMPDELRSLIRPFTGGQDVQETVQLKVIRTRYQVIDADGALRLELADDEVRVIGLNAEVGASRWREAEVELGPAGTDTDLERAAELLVEGGAYPSRAPSKVFRALHGLPVRSPLEPGTAAAAVADYLNVQCDAFTAGHFAISLKPFEREATVEPHDAVHHTRVATRRIRALLRTFAPLFDTEPAARLEEELRWFAAELGEVRDREVLRTRLARAVDDLPAYLVVGPVAQRIDEVLLGELGQHAKALLNTMRDVRYRILVADLAGWREHPPFTAAAGRPARALGEHVAAAEHKLAKRMKRAASKQAGDEELHLARKAGKRARYAAEAAAPALGKRANTLAKAAANLQTLLGEHQDSIVATELLRRIADQVADEGDNAFTYGILVADQRRRAAESARAARDAPTVS